MNNASEDEMAVAEALATLTASAKEVEDKAREVEGKIDTASTAERAKLEEDVERARITAEAHSEELRKKIEETKSDVASWWKDVHKAWEKRVQQIRSNIDEKRHGTDPDEAAKHADAVESDAKLAVAYATTAIKHAEHVALEAVLARDKANKLSAGG